MNESIELSEAPKKSRGSFFRKKAFWIPAIIALLIVGYFVAARTGKQGPFYETRKVEKGNLVQTVEVTGEVKPEARLNLGFKSAGALERVYVKVGQKVNAGDLLAELESRDLRFSAERARAALAIAQANLDARLAGETKESIMIAEAQVEQARAAHEKSKIDLENMRRAVEDDYRVSELALKTAADNLVNSGASAGQSVTTSFSALKSALQAALGPMRAGLLDGDAIIGVDNGSANDNYETVLGVSDSASLFQARQTYGVAKSSATAAENAVRALSSNATHEAILASGELVKTALNATQLYLSNVQRVLAATITNSGLSATQLDALRATIAASRSSVSTQYSAVTSAIEAAKGSGLAQQTTLDQLNNAFETAKANLQIADFNRTSKVRLAENAVVIQAAALNSAQATLAMRKATPRSVDVANLRAAVLDARTAFAQATERLSDVQITAPVSGVITDIVPNVGEQVGAGVTAVKMITDKQFTLEALVPEADITKVEPGQPVAITLDAFGEDVKFIGTVISENPDQTKVSDAIYYKIYTTIEDGGRDMKSGMTANLTVTTGRREGVLSVPTRALRDRDGQRYVRILERGVKEVDVTLGLRGDEGRTEVLSGLSEGQIVVISEVSADEYGKLEAESKVGN